MAGARIAVLLAAILGLSACATAEGFVEDSEAVGGERGEHLSLAARRGQLLQLRRKQRGRRSLCSQKDSRGRG